MFFLTTISLNNLNFSYPGQDPLFQNLTLSWDSSWKLGLLGRNGCGKATLSFFWLGTMWIGMHSEWAQVKKFSSGTLWRILFLLFWAALFPYTTKLVA